MVILTRQLKCTSLRFVCECRLKHAISFYSTPAEAGVLNMELAKYYFVLFLFVLLLVP